MGQGVFMQMVGRNIKMFIQKSFINMVKIFGEPVSNFNKIQTGAQLRKLLFTLIILTGFGTAPAFGHATSWKVDSEATPVTVRFTYTDGRAMALSKVRVLSPDGKVYQVGNADREGYFSFLPASGFENGDWTLKVTGEEDHEIEAVVSASAASDINMRRSSMTSILAWILVASVILNFALLGAIAEKFFKRRQSAKNS